MVTTAVTLPVLGFSIAISLALIVSSASLVALIGRESNREMIKLSSVVRRPSSVVRCLGVRNSYLSVNICMHNIIVKLRYYINSSIVKLQTIYCMEYGSIVKLQTIYCMEYGSAKYCATEYGNIQVKIYCRQYCWSETVNTVSTDGLLILLIYYKNGIQP